MIDTQRFEGFLRPSSVAIVGASPQRNTARNNIVRIVQRHGFAGRVYPVSASHDEIEGLRAYRRLGDLPEVPDVALIITPAKTVPGLIAECGAKGIRRAIVFSAGFEEVEGGQALALELAEAARAHDVAVLGPNCQGVWSVRHKAMLNFSSAALVLENLEHAPIAVVSQSGALAGAIGNALLSAGIGCSYIVSVGNETCVDAVDVLASIVEQDDVRVVALYLEGLNDAARQRGIQIVVLKAGRSTVGQQATASHTGKIASSHAVYESVLAQAGIVSVGSLGDVLLAVETFAFLGHPRASGDAKGGIAVLSSSGGAGALLADHSSELNVPMSEFSDAAAARLDTILPDMARKANPIDLTGYIVGSPKLFEEACIAVNDDPRTEAVVIQFSGGGRRYLRENAEAFKLLARGLPVIISFVGDHLDKDTRRVFSQAGVLLAFEPSVAMRAMGFLYQRQRFQALPALRKSAPDEARPAPRDWAQTMQFCTEAGLTPARWTVLGPRDLAAQACSDMHYPLVVKVLPSESEHKTELGLVRLRVGTAAEVDGIAADFRQRLGKPEAGILVQEMIGDGVEVVLSCMRKTDFGPVITLGSGGVAIELYRDVAHLSLPVSESQVRSALQKLKLWTLLQAFRGKPAADIDALARAAVRFGDLFLASPEIEELEINPVIVKSQGQGINAVDALVTTR